METHTKKNEIRRMTLIAVMAAVICVLGPLSIPIGPVPVSFTNFAIYLSVYLLGGKRGTASYLVYLLIGLVGMPVFSGFSGGAGKLLGPTGGYLIGFIFMAMIFGFFVDRFRDRPLPCIGGMILGTAVTYVFGSGWLAIEGGMSFSQALAAGVVPFIGEDLVKMLAAAALGPRIYHRLQKAGLV